MLLSAVTAGSASANSFVINATFDSSITSLSNALAIESSINNVISFYEATFLDPISVNITFSNMTSGLGQSSFNLYTVTYANFRSALVADRTSADDTTALANLAGGAGNPVNGGTDILIKSATRKALGLLSGSFAASDGTVSLNTSLMNIDRTGAQNAGLYDLQAVTSHEINEILGLGSTLGLGLSAPFNSEPSPEDLFRYDGSGGRSFNESAVSSYLSIDGTTLLAAFNQSSGGDYGDWQTAGAAKVQDAFGTPGSQPNMGVEIRALDAIGYDVATAPEPSTWLLIATGIIAGAIYRKRKTSLVPVPVVARYNNG